MDGSPWSLAWAEWLAVRYPGACGLWRLRWLSHKASYLHNALCSSSFWTRAVTCAEWQNAGGRMGRLGLSVSACASLWSVMAIWFNSEDIAGLISFLTYFKQIEFRFVGRATAVPERRVLACRLGFSPCRCGEVWPPIQENDGQGGSHQRSPPTCSPNAIPVVKYHILLTSTICLGMSQF